MDLGIAGRVALVAASSRGLGRSVADALAAEGCTLILCSRDQGRIEAAAREVADRFGVVVHAVAGDLSRASDVERIVETGVAAVGPVDILVTNTGGPPPGRFATLEPGQWEEAIRQNLDSVLNLVRGVLSGMEERGWGRIVNVTSISVKQPVEGLMLSNAVRAAVTGFARTLANEVARRGVTVNNVLPGYTRTERVQQLAEGMARERGVSVEDALAAWEEDIPMGRLGTPAEFAAAVAFLASEPARYITGVSLPVDGGWIRSLF